EVPGASWMPDNRHVVVSTNQAGERKYHLWLMDSDRETIRPITTGIMNEMYPAVSPSGKQLLFAAGYMQYDLIEVPLDGSAIRNLTSTLPLDEKTPAWSSQGNQFAYVADKNGADVIWLKSLPNGFERPLVSQKDFSDEPTILLSRPQFSPDGERIAYHRETKSGTAIWISSVTGGGSGKLYTEKGNQYTPSWSPDGNSIAYIAQENGDMSLAVARIGAGTEPKILVKNISYFQPQWS